MSNHKLQDTPEITWGNTILYRLAKALDKSYHVEGDVESPKAIFTINPDDLLEEALEIIWRYKELEK